MARSSSRTVGEYLKELPPERRKTIAAVRAVIRKHLPAGYVEAMNWGMISYEVPLSRYPKTYNGQPLNYAALASQKQYCSLYLMGVYQSPHHLAELKAAFAKAGKRLNMGKSCIRFQAVEDLPLAQIGRIVASTPVRTFIEFYEAARSSRGGTSPNR